MPELENRKHERFCMAIVNGKNGKEAYLAQYPKVTEKRAYEGASKLLKLDKIKARIDQIKEEAGKIVAEARQELHKEAVKETAEGLRRIVGDKLTKEEMLAFIGEVVRTPLGKLTASSILLHSLETTDSPGDDDMSLHKLKAHDKLRAIELAAKLEGMMVEKVDMSVKDKRVLPPDERARLLRESIARRTPAHGRS